jgi:hypothetical protein
MKISTELAIPSTQLLCEHIMRQKGTDRGNGERLRIDADWTQPLETGDMKLRLIQSRGLGAGALYTLRVATPGSEWTDYYHYRVASGDMAQSVASHDTGHTAAIILPGIATVVDQLLRSGIETSHSTS